ncbi:hypothetical protein [Fusibacter sp. 3D3]|uniref:hypothetical protein n=1 Tax=Fusibacter sp. 3D3 TaxID=1048380 RepID=UPI000853A7D3|nr:hypothetical protein [Fusibacter sp. 3D3]GAU78379.1 5'-nucleotidase [Fusibacter sp. 3D3]
MLTEFRKKLVTYTIGDKTVYDQPMYERSEELNDKTEAGNNYAYRIPDNQILETAPSFTFTITAIDVAGLQTVSEPSTVSIIHNYHVTVGPPSSADDHTQLKPATPTQDNNTDNNTDDYTDNTHVTTITSTIKEVLALESDTENITVTGQIAYFATNYAHPVIHAIIDGTPYSLYIYGSAPADSKIGDLVKLTGTYSIQTGLPMLRAITAREIVGSSTQVAPETVTISDLKTNGLNMLGRFIKIKDVTLGTYRAFGLTEISDVTGNMNIYKAAAYPTLVEAGDKVDLYATVACDGSTVQLNTGTKEANTYNVYDTINDTTPPLGYRAR